MFNSGVGALGAVEPPDVVPLSPVGAHRAVVVKVIVPSITAAAGVAAAAPEVVGVVAVVVGPVVEAAAVLDLRGERLPKVLRHEPVNDRI